ncbi:hypothetical protein EKO27_g11064 [Xylaria grammica]|uniref:Uncharacterized protein n=1 Tax=Xylaria grammica TaxID=363999 RepID=A0A439CPH2_9PEZI|nr:hypothetical protein EKO27_g11064 [Xylaria grammica]
MSSTSEKGPFEVVAVPGSSVADDLDLFVLAHGFSAGTRWATHRQTLAAVQEFTQVRAVFNTKKRLYEAAVRGAKQTAKDEEDQKEKDALALIANMVARNSKLESQVLS